MNRNEVMTNKNEMFSAFVDSELTSGESNEQINEASIDVNARYRMQRYLLMGNVMRQEAGDAVNLAFASQISEKIAQLEPIVKTAEPYEEKAESVSFLTRWFRPVTGLAVAASVAWVAVVSLQGLMNVDSRTGEFTKQANEIALSAPQTDVSEQVSQLALSPVFTKAINVSTPIIETPLQNKLQWRSAQSQSVSQAKLNAYLVTHTEYSSSMQGMISQARIAGYDVSQ